MLCFASFYLGESGVRSHLVGMKGHRSNRDGRVADLSLWVEGKFKSKENMDRQPINPHKNRGKKAHLIA